MKQNLLFRELQNNLVLEFLSSKLNSHIIIEFGGTNDMNYRGFSKSSNYLITNLEGEVDQIEDIRSLSFESNSIDAAICISVLQHVFEFDQAINEIIRVLKPGGTCLITNGFNFPVCMEHDYYRFTPQFWKKRLENENVKFEIISLGNKYSATLNTYMRPYGNYRGFWNKVNKLVSLPFALLSYFNRSIDNSPLGVAVIITKN